MQKDTAASNLQIDFKEISPSFSCVSFGANHGFCYRSVKLAFDEYFNYTLVPEKKHIVLAIKPIEIHIYVPIYEGWQVVM